ncbi:cytochrome P450, partial [Mycobacterium sp.]|uniref:cytochrome P450 n=1 Tax=Mycobacterium sp. TaxID=1785 RepID=UPI003C75455A
QCEFVHEVAYQLPLHMIADIMGIPYADRKWVFDKVDLMLQAMDPQSPMSLEEQATAILESYQYAHVLGEDKRRNPTDDVWTTLASADVELPDGTRTRLSEEELAIFFVVLTVGGSETTRNAIAGGLMVLLEHPDQFKLLRDDPTLVSTAVEEILRWTSPLTYFRRTAAQDVTIGDQHIKAGDRVTMWFPSANRDEDVFDNPFGFDITRANNPHVAFGAGGPHYCLGANLARRELKAFLEELLSLVGDIEIVGQPEYSVQGIENPITLGFKNLPVQLSPRSATRLAGHVAT